VVRETSQLIAVDFSRSSPEREQDPAENKLGVVALIMAANLWDDRRRATSTRKAFHGKLENKSNSVEA